jgi:CHAT domain-containing protein
MAFLPVHAAGTYCRQDKAGVDACFSDYCVVSYTPTLGALLERDSYPAAGEMKMLLAAAPRPFRSLPLPAAEKEMDVLSKIVPRRFRMPTAVAHDSSSYARTADDVLHLLPDATILHLACHGYQDPVKPLESGFLMEDKMIKVADLVQLNLPNARLAFLSACETAQGDMERPDEALHLAATMLFTGFKSVVATMWSMNDVDGPVVAETVYRELFAGDGDELDFDVVPYALDAAIRKLREQGLEISRWAPYIHVGV